MSGEPNERKEMSRGTMLTVILVLGLLVAAHLYQASKADSRDPNVRCTNLLGVVDTSCTAGMAADRLAGKRY